jgi:hypothetical protein
VADVAVLDISETESDIAGVVLISSGIAKPCTGTFGLTPATWMPRIRSILLLYAVRLCCAHGELAKVPSWVTVMVRLPSALDVGVATNPQAPTADE